MVIFVYMEDFSTLIYIAAGVIYLIIRLMGGNKKKQQKQQKRQPGSRPQQGRSNAPKSFEELLQEFTEEANQQVQPKEEKAEEPDYGWETIHDRSKPAVEEEVTGTFVSDEEAVTRYQESVRMAQQSHSIDDLTSRMGKVRRGRMKPYKINKSKGSKELQKVRDMFAKPESLRQAVILKEIIDKKY